MEKVGDDDPRVLLRGESKAVAGRAFSKGEIITIYSGFLRDGVMTMRDAEQDVAEYVFERDYDYSVTFKGENYSVAPFSYKKSCSGGKAMAINLCERRGENIDESCAEAFCSRVLGAATPKARADLARQLRIKKEPAKGLAFRLTVHKLKQANCNWIEFDYLVSDDLHPT